MPGITFTKEDLAASNKLPSGWYKLNIGDISEGPGKNDHPQLHGLVSSLLQRDHSNRLLSLIGSPIR